MGYEARFNADLLKRIVESRNTIVYGEWLLRFCVSLSWRVLIHCRGKNPDAIYTDVQEKLCVEATQRWKSFLLCSAPHPAQFCQQLLIFTELGHAPVPGMPHNINRYMLGGIEMDIVGSDKSLMTFAKIGPVVVFGIIQPPKGDWNFTKVQVRGGTVQPGRFQAPASLGSFFFDRARLVSGVYDKMSDTQHHKVQREYTAAISNDPEGFAESHHGRAILADARMFGENSILDKRS